MADSFEMEIWKLQKELSENRTRMNEELEKQRFFFQTQLKANDKKITDYITKQKKRIEESFLEKTQNLQRETDHLMDEYISKQRKIEAEYQEKQRSIIESIRELNEENKKKITGLEKQVNRREENAKEAYNAAHSRLVSMEQSVQDQPVKLLLGKVPDFDVGKKAMEKMCRKNMYETAAGHADHIAMEYELLLNEIDIKVKEWETEFYHFNTLVQVLYDRFRGFDEMPVSTPYASGIVMSAEEKDFWSQGKYGEIRKLLEEATTLAADISTMGMRNYLIAHKEDSIEPMLEKYLQVRGWKNRVYAIIRAVTNERYYSDQRYVWGNNIIIFMEKAGYILQDCYWEEALGSMREKEWYRLTHPDSTRPENQLGFYRMVFGFGERDTVTITISPGREYGIVTKNLIQIDVEMTSSHDEVSMQEIMKDSVKIVFKATGTRAAKFVSGPKNEPSVAEQEKYMNLCYGENLVKI